MPQYKLIHKVYGKRQVLDFKELSEAKAASINMFRSLSGSPQCIMLNNTVLLDKEDLINDWITSGNPRSEADKEDTNNMSSGASEARHVGKV